MNNAINHNAMLKENLATAIALIGFIFARITASEVLMFLTALMTLTAIAVNIIKFLDYRDRRRARKNKNDEKIS